ncbi:MAG: flagellar M-ring protein FliF C-terminal domain-containing protein, partial [Desulfocapsaceae bacterium]
ASARVILTAGSPSNTEFEKSNPSASVFVSLLPGRALSQEYIKTIVHFMSASVYGLPAQNISIIYSQGSVLKDSSNPSDGISASADILSYQQQVEKRLEARIQPLLDRILGNNRAIVKIAAEIDFSKTQKTLEIYDPVEPVVKSEHYIDEPAGVSGTSKNESTVTYEVSKTTSRITSPVGRIERLTVSILVDQSIASDTVDAAQPDLDKAMLLAIEKMLSGTIGFNAIRGDQLHLVTVPLGRPADISATVESLPANLLYDYLPAARFGLVLIGFILLYILLIRPLIKTLASEFDKHRPAEERSLPDTFRAEQEPEQEYTALVQEEVLQNPSPAAHIIRKWIQDT